MAADDRIELTRFVQHVDTERTVLRSDRARARFKTVMQTLVDEGHGNETLAELADLELFEAATALTKQK